MTKDYYTGDKYIYLLMGYKLALKSKKGIAIIGEDNGFKGGYKYYRKFTIQKYAGLTLLTETKTTRNFADFSKTYEVIAGSKTDIKPYIKHYYNESHEDCSINWIH